MTVAAGAELDNATRLYRDRILRDPLSWAGEWEYCRNYFDHYCATWVWIVDMDGNEVLFRHNPVQRAYMENVSNMDIILKSRKLGFSTLKLIRGLYLMSFWPNENCVLMAHHEDPMVELIDKLKFSYYRLPQFLRCSLSRKPLKELIFDKFPDTSPLRGRESGSRYKILTAAGAEPGRGKDLSFLHLSEFAWYPDIKSIKAGPLCALRNRAECSIETTANGQNEFYEEYRDAKEKNSLFRAHFFSWTEDPRCVAEVHDTESWHPHVRKAFTDFRLPGNVPLTPEQGQFYQNVWLKLRDIELMKQEYPLTDTECFISSGRPFFDPDMLQRLGALARQHKPVLEEEH